MDDISIDDEPHKTDADNYHENTPNKNTHIEEEWHTIPITSNKMPSTSTIDMHNNQKINIKNPYKNTYNIQVKNHIQKKHDQSVNVCDKFVKFAKELLNAGNIALLPFGEKGNTNPITSALQIPTSQVQFNKYCHEQNIIASNTLLYYSITVSSTLSFRSIKKHITSMVAK